MFDFIKNLFKIDYSKYTKINETPDATHFMNLDQVLQKEVIDKAYEYLNSNHPDMINAFEAPTREEQVTMFKDSLSILVEGVKK
jgi:hypothetical protein